MNEKFKRELQIGAGAINPYMRLAPSGVFDLLQETATIHSDSLGYDMSYFIRERKGWALLSWYAVFQRLPLWREKVTAETWPTEGKGLVANRNFRIVDSEGVPIVKAFSQWVYFDNERRRPVKIPEDLFMAYKTDIENVLPYEKAAVALPEKSVKIGGSRLTVRRSHTDSNFHVNNVAYIRWAEDDLPDSVFYSRKLRAIRINYRREAKIGDEIETVAYESQNGACFSFINDAEGNTLVEIQTEYED